jgi:hypothetical protein
MIANTPGQSRLACILWVLLAGCAGKGKPAPAAAPAPGSTGCGPEAFAGPWLIESGVAKLTCDDGTDVSLVAGGNIRLEAPTMPGGPLTMVDGQCRFPVARSGCTLVGPAGVACSEGDVRYSSRSIQIERDPSGALALAYVLEQPDPDNPRAKCVASTQGKLARAARTGEGCALDGRWKTDTTPEGRPGATVLAVAKGRCALLAPGFTGEGPCQRDGDLLTLKDGGGKGAGCAAGAAGRYVMTFAADCAALELEARDDGCPARRGAVEFLYLLRERGP